MRAALALATLASLAGASALAAQREPITRRAAIEAALARGPRVALATGDTLAARAQLSIARAFQNPSLSATYSKSTPQYHAILDLPLDWPWLRAARVGAARAASGATSYRFAFARAGARFDAEGAYIRALAAQAHARLSRGNARDADSLLQMAELRRDAGDASQLDVELARVNAGQLANDAQRDSLDLVAALLDLQVVMGLGAEQVTIALADSLALPADTAGPPVGTALGVAAAEAALAAEERTVALERRSVLGPPSFQVGFESRDPTGAEPGVLPTVGIALPLPLFNLNGGPIALAQAGRDRARAELEITRRESAAAIARAGRERAAALARHERDRRLLQSASSVAAMALTAYAEGAAALPSVLEAERSAREALARSIDDLAAAEVADAALRLLTAGGAP